MFGCTSTHTCDLDMRRAYAIGVLDSIEDTSKVHMYWRNVQGLRVKAFVVFCLLLNVCCLGHSCWSTAARYNKIIDTTIILQPKGRHYCDFLSFMFEVPLGILKSGYCILKDAIIAMF